MQTWLHYIFWSLILLDNFLHDTSSSLSSSSSSSSKWDGGKSDQHWRPVPHLATLPIGTLIIQFIIKPVTLMHRFTINWLEPCMFLFYMFQSWSDPSLSSILCCHQCCYHHFDHGHHLHHPSIMLHNCPIHKQWPAIAVLIALLT